MKGGLSWGGEDSWLKKVYKSFSFRIRLLPVVIFSASLLLTAKLSTLFKIFVVSDPIINMAHAQAEDPKSAASSKKAETVEEDPSTLKGVNPSATTTQQFNLLKALKEQQAKLKEEEKKLPEKEATVKVIEKKIEEKTKALEEAHRKLEELVKGVDEKEKVNLDRLVKMAEAMKPTEAAPILEGIDFAVLIEIMEKIKPAKASAILAAMAPKKAAYLMTQLALRKKVIKS